VARKEIQDQRHASKESLKRTRDDSRADDDSRYSWQVFVKDQFNGKDDE
jgi:hypothetical protein